MHCKVWMFFHLIDDEDLAFLQREFISYQQAMEYYGLRYKPVVRMSHVSGSVYMIGKRYDVLGHHTDKNSLWGASL